ncbi:MAG: UvrD-helicase domain-containing protein [Alistipes sp.]|nr:UvrD-helicase domain-containing protein [Alistipes sp.]
MRARVLSASAGSGKTFRLAYKFVHDTIEHFNDRPYLYRAILAVTFTNKATEEMKSRILQKMSDLVRCPQHCDYMELLRKDLKLSEQEISKRAGAILRRILHDYSRFTILTIDKFFLQIMRAFLKELGMDINPNVEIETASLLSRSTDALIEDITSDEELQHWITSFVQENVEEGDKWDIRRSLTEQGAMLFDESSREALEGAASKEKLHAMVKSAEQVTHKTQSQMQSLAQRAVEIISAANLSPADFSGGERSFVKYFYKVAKGDFSAPSATARSKATEDDRWSKDSVAQSLTPQLQPLLAQICDLYDEHVHDANTLELIRNRYRSFALLQDIYRKVCECQNEDGSIVLSETKHILAQFIAQNDVPFIYEKVGNRFERFMIDEFQDTSRKEWSNFVPLLRNAMSQDDEESVFIVGDIKQSIYRWRGGDWRILAEGVKRDLGPEEVQSEVIETNWRSLPEIVKFNSDTIESIVNSDNDTLNAILGKALESEKIDQTLYNELYNTLKTAYTGHRQQACKRAENQGYICIERYSEEPPLVRCIASAIERGYSYSDIMVLHRSKRDEQTSAEILLDYKQRNNLNFNIMTQESLIIGRAPICQFIIAILRLSQNCHDKVNQALANDYLSQISHHRAFDSALEAEDESLLRNISQLTPDEAFEHIVAHYHLDEQQGDIAYLQALHEQIISFCTSKVADIQLFLKEWDEKGSEKALIVERNSNTIELLTIHKAKGLEKRVVIIPDCSWPLKPRPTSTIWATTTDHAWADVGCFPVPCSLKTEGSAFSQEYYRELVYSHVDNINLLYVALTRASEELYILIPDKNKSSKNSKSKPKEEGEKSVGELVWNAVKSHAHEDGTMVEFGIQANKQEQAKENKCKECPSLNGCRKALAEEAKPRNIILKEYPSNPHHPALSTPSQRYFEEEATGIASQREVGILMHSILCEAASLEDIEQRISEARLSGTIDIEQEQELRACLEREFGKDCVKEWFSDSWDKVRNEQDIICGEIVGTRRPDRVMLRGKQAVVVDYKFGAEKPRSHRLQIEEYMRLLRNMGYTEVEGYLWYLTLGEIVKVD